MHRGKPLAQPCEGRVAFRVCSWQLADGVIELGRASGAEIGVHALAPEPPNHKLFEEAKTRTLVFSIPFDVGELVLCAGVEGKKASLRITRISQVPLGGGKTTENASVVRLYQGQSWLLVIAKVVKV